MNDPQRIRVVDAVDRKRFQTEIRRAAEPVVLKGLLDHWPIVRAARESHDALARLIKSFDIGATPHVIEAPPGAQGRLFYSDDFSGFNFERRPASIGDVVDRLSGIAGLASPPALFLESMPVNRYAPGFRAAHDMPLLDEEIEPRLWLGNAVKVNTHFDLAYNLACVAAGRRRFTLFPPGQIGNLYVAPFDFTPSGAPVSLVEFTRPDHTRFPRFVRALEHARSAELDPGDAIYIPYGWWHHVESLTPFNVLVNYWWNDAPAFAAPHGALLHSLIAIRTLPADQRAVWEAMFAELVFKDPEQALAHLPQQVRGMFAPISAQRAREFRKKLRTELSDDPPG